MKKLIYALICALLAAVLAVTAFAAETAEMTLDTAQKTVAPGETMVFTVSLSALEKCSSAGLTLSYDKTVFEFLGGSCSLKNTLLASVKDDACVFTYGKAVAVSGEIFTFQLKVKDSAAAGSYTITAKGSVRDGEGIIPTKVNSVTVAVAVETTEPTNAPTIGETVPPKETEPAPAETVPVKPTEPAAEETTPTETATEPAVSAATEPAADTAPVSKETEPVKGPQSAAPEEPVYTIGAETEEPRKGFPWWIVAVTIVVALAVGCIVFFRKRK